MEHLSKVLQNSLSQNKEMQERLLVTIDKMADGLVAANKQALAPIDRSCTIISVLQVQKECVKAVGNLREHFYRTSETQVTQERIFEIKVSELELRTGSCQLSFNDEKSEERISGQISDPLSAVPKIHTWQPLLKAFF